MATFFRQTEPHSPISYLVQRAVRWGNMPLEELLKEVVKHSDALDRIWDTLGIKPTDKDRVVRIHLLAHRRGNATARPT